MRSAQETSIFFFAFQTCAQRLAIEELHDDVEIAVLGTVEIGDLTDVRVVEVRGQTCLSAESPERLGVSRDVDMHHFDGHMLAQREMFGTVNFAHGAPADDIHDSIPFFQDITRSVLDIARYWHPKPTFV